MESTDAPKVPKLDLEDEDIEAQNTGASKLDITDEEAENSEIPKNTEAQNSEVPALEITDLENDSLSLEGWRTFA